MDRGPWPGTPGGRATVDRATAVAAAAAGGEDQDNPAALAAATGSDQDDKNYAGSALNLTPIDTSLAAVAQRLAAPGRTMGIPHLLACAEPHRYPCTTSQAQD